MFNNDYYNVIELSNGIKFVYLIHDEFKQLDFYETMHSPNHKGKPRFYVHKKGYGGGEYPWSAIVYYNIFDGRDRYLEEFPNDDLEIIE